MSLAAIAAETLAIVDAGRYTAPSGASVELAADVAAAVRGTRLYRPEELAQLVEATGQRPGQGHTRIEVTRESTAEAGRRLWAEGERDIAVLNFASARNVGGGFLGGARAQEEELCRASALYPCLQREPEYYAANRAHPDALYTDHAIWSPRVPFFRDAARRLLDAPVPLSVITSPAPNTGAVRDAAPRLVARIGPTFHRRAATVLAIARHQGHGCLVLGAWGCGAFRGDPALAAAAFDEPLRGAFAGAFRRVVFAVLVARPADEANHLAFAARFG